MARMWILFLLALGLMAPNVGYTDTYNFIFSKPKKNMGANEEAEQPSVEEDSKEQTKAKEAPAPAQPSQQQVVPNQTPVVINNNITTAQPPAPAVAQPVPVPAPAPAAVQSPAPLAPAVSQEITPPVTKERSRRFSLGLSYYGIAQKHDEFNDLNNAYGPIVTFGFRMFDHLSWNSQFGYAKTSDSASKVRLSTELVFLPILIGPHSFNVLEIGGLIGVSNTNSSPDELLTAHIGLLLNLNLTESFGLTLVSRANKGYGMGEVGFYVKL